MTNKYIVELLKTNTRVILPDFGAFMVKKIAGSEEPQISFNDFLKYNDGLLVNFITKKEGISSDEAQKKIKLFVEAINKDLKANQPYKLDVLGYLYKDSRGSVRFKMGGEKPEIGGKSKVESSRSAVTLDEKAKATASVKMQTPVAKEVKRSTEKTAVVKPGGTTINDKLSQSKAAVVGEKTQIKTASSVTKPATGAIPPKKPIDNKTKATVGTVPPRKTVENKSKSTSEGSKSNTLIITAAIVVIVGAIAIIFYLNMDVVKGWFGKEKKETVVMVDSAVIKANQLRLDSLKRAQYLKDSIDQVEQDKIQKEKNEKEEKLKNQKKYYLVAGSFKTKKYAERFVQKLRNDGHNAEIFMERRGFYRVSYNGYIDRQEAFNEYRKMKGKGVEVWVLRY